MTEQGPRLERQIGHYLAGSDDGANRLALWTAARELSKRLGAGSLAATLDMLCAEFIATHGGKR